VVVTGGVVAVWVVVLWCPAVEVLDPGLEAEVEEAGLELPPQADSASAAAAVKSAIRGMLMRVSQAMPQPSQPRPEPGEFDPQRYARPVESFLSKLDPFWGPQLLVAAAIALDLLLPNKLTIGPTWLLPAIEGVLLVVLLAVSQRPRVRPSALRRNVAMGFVGLVSAANIFSLIELCRYLLNGHATRGRPLIFAGGGILGSGAWEELQRLAEMLGAAVIMTENGRGALSDRHPLGMTPLVSPVLTPRADVILAVGTRFLQPLTMPWGPKPGQTVIRLDVDSEEITRVSKPDIAIVADAKAGLTQLAERVQKHNRSRAARSDEFAALKAEATAQLNSIEPQAGYALAIRAELPEDGIFVSEMTQVGYWSRQGFPVYQPRTFVGAGYQGTLGFGFGTALGVAVGNPDKKVVSISGTTLLQYVLLVLFVINFSWIALAATSALLGFGWLIKRRFARAHHTQIVHLSHMSQPHALALDLDAVAVVETVVTN